MNCGDRSTARITGFMFVSFFRYTLDDGVDELPSPAPRSSLTNQVQSRRARRLRRFRMDRERVDQIEPVLHAGRGAAASMRLLPFA